MKTKKIKTLYLTNFIFRDIFLLDYRAAEEFSLQFKLKTIQYDLNMTRIANVHYFEFISNYHTESDYHPFHELVYVDRGEMHVKAENYQGVLRAQQFILHLPNEKHMLSCDLGSAPSVIIIVFECNCPRLDFLSQQPITLSLQNQRLLGEIIKESRSVFLPPYDIPNLEDMKKRKDFPFGADQLIKSQLEYFFIKLIREHESEESKSADAPPSDAPSNLVASENPLLTEICHYIKEHLTQKLTLSELSLLFATNKTTLCALFRNNLNCTAVDYINKERLELAKQMMRKNDKTLTQIADELNFSSVHYFTRLFTKHENMPPTQYLKMIKTKQNIE